jgi:hypothetical protein
MDTSDTTTGISPALRKTAGFLAAGAALLAAGWLAQPRFRPAKVEPAEERILFPELTDAGKAASLEIVSYDEEVGEVRPFKVIKSGGVWVLPSHQNYPADAKDHLAAAATELVDLKALDVVSQSPADHEVYGVIEPDLDKLKLGMTGVGQLVEIRDASGTKLARLVIGKEDRRRGGDASAGQTLRFVRKAGQDPVYRVAIDTSKFTTSFGDWIEKDLLKLSPWDVRRVTLDDYTLAAVESGGRLRVQQNRESRMELAYDDKSAKWSATKIESFPDAKDGKPGESVQGTEETLAEDEELAATALNDLRNAVGDLKIVDVARKPAGLSADLRAEEAFTSDLEAVTSLQQRGFLPLSSGEILSTNGQTVIGMKDGVEYVLRFGAGTTVNESQPAGEDATAESEPEKPAAETSSRYLLVMARLNESLLTKPDLEPLPDLPVDQKAAEEKPAEKPANGPAETPAAKEGDGAGNGSEADTKKETQPGESGDGDQTAVESTGSAENAADAASSEAAEKETGGASEADGKAKEPSAAELLKQADEAEAAMQTALEARRRVERENRRKQEAFDEQIEAGRKRVRELNNRFADWYYIVSEKEFEKIHLDRAGVVRKKAETKSEEVGKD